MKSIRNGNIWFQSPKYYQEYVGAGEISISDPSEIKYDYIKQLNEKDIQNKFHIHSGTEMILNGRPFILDKIQNARYCHYMSDQEANKYRLFCMYGLKCDEKGQINIPDERIKQFGDYFSVVDIDKLIIKVRKSLKNKNINITSCAVAYIVTQNYEGAYNATFKGSNKFSYQNEYRIILYSSNFDTLESTEHYEYISDSLLYDCFSEPFPIEYLYNSKTMQELSDKTGISSAI